MDILAIIVLTVCALIVVGFVVWFAKCDYEAFFVYLGIIVAVFIFSGVLTWALMQLKIVY